MFAAPSVLHSVYCTQSIAPSILHPLCCTQCIASRVSHPEYCTQYNAPSTAPRGVISLSWPPPTPHSCLYATVHHLRGGGWTLSRQNMYIVCISFCLAAVCPVTNKKHILCALHLWKLVYIAFWHIVCILVQWCAFLHNAVCTVCPIWAKRALFVPVACSEPWLNPSSPTCTLCAFWHKVVLQIVCISAQSSVYSELWLSRLSCPPAPRIQQLGTRKITTLHSLHNVFARCAVHTIFCILLSAHCILQLHSINCSRHSAYCKLYKSVE